MAYMYFKEYLSSVYGTEMFLRRVILVYMSSLVLLVFINDICVTRLENEERMVVSKKNRVNKESPSEQSTNRGF